MREPEVRRLATWLLLVGMLLSILVALLTIAQVEVVWPEPALEKDPPCTKCGKEE